MHGLIYTIQCGTHNKYTMRGGNTHRCRTVYSVVADCKDSYLQKKVDTASALAMPLRSPGQYVVASWSLGVSVGENVLGEQKTTSTPKVHDVMVASHELGL